MSSPTVTAKVWRDTHRKSGRRHYKGVVQHGALITLVDDLEGGSWRTIRSRTAVQPDVARRLSAARTRHQAANPPA